MKNLIKLKSGKSIGGNVQRILLLKLESITTETKKIAKKLIQESAKAGARCSQVSKKRCIFNHDKKEYK